MITRKLVILILSESFFGTEVNVINMNVVLNVKDNLNWEIFHNQHV
jgi:hypothetical protein